MKELIPVRLSHLLRHCSVGSIVRGANYLMTIKDIREWTDKNGINASRAIPYVERVRNALMIEEELREPPLAREREKGKGLVDGTCIPAIKFPFWMRCPNCGLMHYKPWRQSEDDRKSHCRATRKDCPNLPELEQVPWVMVHQYGYMADVPWHSLTHKNAKGSQQDGCKQNSTKNHIRLIQNKVTGEYSLECTVCAARAGFHPQMELPYGNFTPEQPWLKSAPEMPLEDLAQIMEINDTRAHIPKTDNALVIPPESRIRKGTIEDRLYSSSENRKQIEHARNPLAKKAAFRQLATHLKSSPLEVEKAWDEISSGRYPPKDASVTTGQLMEDEYKALLEENTDYFDDEDFVARHKTSKWKDLTAELDSQSRAHLIVRSIDRLVAVTRLKEIQVFKGFRRINGSSEKPVPPDIDDSSGWLPAIELYGEGIFFTFDESALRGWESLPIVKGRVHIFNSRLERSGVQFEHEFLVSPRFLLLHTIAHILIRKLETKAGYPAASLKERIYCKTGRDAMSGILVYVAVPDIVGSLGGIAELAEPKRILTLLISVFGQAEWCSLDPVCSEHDGQGPGLLNRAACHACALVPEPSCAYDNTLLDRTFIKGDIQGGMPGFLQCLESMGKSE